MIIKDLAEYLLPLILSQMMEAVRHLMYDPPRDVDFTAPEDLLGMETLDIQHDAGLWN